MEILFVYTKAKSRRTYTLSSGPSESTEVWVDVQPGRGPAKRRRLARVNDTADIHPFLESIRQDLRAGGWTER
jgi:ferredoxin-NADP reductase